MREQQLTQILDEIDGRITAAMDRIVEAKGGDNCPRVSLELLQYAEQFAPQFEWRLDIGDKMRRECPELNLPGGWYLFSVCLKRGSDEIRGALLGGDLICVEANTPNEAFEKAAAGLQETVNIAKDKGARLIELPDTTSQEDGMTLDVAGRRAAQGAPMNPEMRNRISQIFSDRISRRLH